LVCSHDFIEAFLGGPSLRVSMHKEQLARIEVDRAIESVPESPRRIGQSAQISPTELDRLRGQLTEEPTENG